MLQALRRLFGTSRPGVNTEARSHMTATEWPAAIYAIGDVHGCLEQLRELERLIVEDASTIPGKKWLVYLGDYIDRGPNSAGVLDKLLSAPPAGFRRICLVGNHEVMALAFLRNPQAGADWLAFGGLEFLHSYQLSATALVGGSARSRLAIIDSHIPSEHIDFLRDLPLSLAVPGYVFVHAGLRPGVALEQQRENDLLWIRQEFFDAPPRPGITIVHGHTPAPEPVVTTGRICIDTGAFATGILTALRLIPGAAPQFFHTHNAR